MLLLVSSHLYSPGIWISIFFERKNSKLQFKYAAKKKNFFFQIEFGILLPIFSMYYVLKVFLITIFLKNLLIYFARQVALKIFAYTYIDDWKIISWKCLQYILQVHFKKNDHLHIVIYEYERLLSTEPGICIRYMPYIINNILFIWEKAIQCYI